MKHEAPAPADEHARRWYWRVYRAARKRDRERLVHLIAERPDLHNYEGAAGDALSFIRHEAPELLEAAFKAGLSPDAGEDPTHETLLQSAAANGDLDLLHLAIRHGADLERRNDVGEVALGYAASWGQLTAAQAMIDAGACVNAIEEEPITGYRNTPLDCTGRYPEIAALLRAHGGKTLSELEGGNES